MIKKLFVGCMLGSFLVHFRSNAETEKMILQAQKPVILPGPAAKFDFLASDKKMNRILAAHRGAKTLEIFDLKAGSPLPSVDVGHAQGLAISETLHLYFTGNEVEHSITLVDSRTLKKTGEVSVDGPVDAIAFAGKSGKLYAAEDDGDHLWVIDAKRKKLVGTIAIPGVPEVLDYDAKTNRVYVNIKSKDEIVRINPQTDKVDAIWPSAPATSPHGLVVDSKRGQIYVAGGNGKLVVINTKTGKLMSEADIAKRADQIAFDGDTQTIYSACRGYISVTKVSGHTLHPEENVPSPKGAHTLAVDPKSHDVWVAYSDTSHSFLQRFSLAR